ncbi:carboxymuconolactone decarboxylase family protein [Bacillus sp. N1-1]|jgi:alkylhydroperoxidase family enzyme|uniref:carboxymuconolactone decarboxylase family protein n=1 Tax=Bacillus sp. N1-1 TaxID=2682541 RepID=UPI0013174400|nr:carboxymuconolactone decarboxylase family protein [Bacillus sp. N1-1]QHA91010.1 carboxymuconolactone decarboxylase family protein [Bacillus sp. N1-1]
MTIIEKSNLGATPFQQLLGHNPKAMTAWATLGDVLESDQSLSSTLKEQVRRTLAQNNGCEYCKAKGKPDPSLFDEKISLAVGFAEVYIKLNGDVPSSIIEVLKESFTDQEVSELFAFICFTTAQQHFGALMKLKPAIIKEGEGTS